MRFTVQYCTVVLPYLALRAQQGTTVQYSTEKRIHDGQHAHSWTLLMALAFCALQYCTVVLLVAARTTGHYSKAHTVHDGQHAHSWIFY
jgi:hypothetical protein